MSMPLDRLSAPPWQPKVVSFDCAETLLRTRWDPSQVAVDALTEAGESLPVGAYDAYRSLLGKRWAHFQELNLTGDLAQCDAFWEVLGRNWLAGFGMGEAVAQRVSEIAWRRIYDPEGDLFQKFPDVVPCLDELRDRGYRMIVLSNWDLSLTRFLQVHGLSPYFEVIVPSLRYGVEKPSLELFEIARKAVGSEPGEMLHIGDHLIDDFQGARDAGWMTLHLDRGRTESTPPFLHDLCELGGWLC
ncbi:MAG: HAD-IA family hydrolase [Chthonomonas sp.]|nr:HAD-IA family hydrolase [Chthonomonas sp.]